MENIALFSPNTIAEFEHYYQFRWQQLRQPINLPIGSEKDECESTSFHLMAMNERQNIIGVGRISPEDEGVMRIRYMAVASGYRQRGVGSTIVRSLLNYARQHGANRCWLNARADAVEFYKRNGFEVIKAIETDLPIPHFQMEIKI